MIGPEGLSVMVETLTKLKKTGKDRWRGLCPFHKEGTASFFVYRGRDGRGRFHCHGCHTDGDAVDWLRMVEHKSYREAGGCTPDQEVMRQRKEEKRREGALRQFRDHNPDCDVPDFLIKI